MASTSASRATLLQRHHLAMREFNAYVVLLQDAIARSVGLNGTDLQIVTMLMTSGPATPGELSRRTGVSVGGAITSAIDRLEKAGYVRRKRGTLDRRTVVIEPVPEALFASVGVVYRRIAERWDAHLAGLSDSEVTAATELLEAAAHLNRDEITQLRASYDPAASDR